MRSVYDQQVELVIKCLPLVAQVEDFALKGGTAINLLVRYDYPRASIDIDLTYTHVAERKESLLNIEKGLLNIKQKILDNIHGSIVHTRTNRALSLVTKLDVFLDKVSIKIEPNLILRGTVFGTQVMNISDAVEKYYGATAKEIHVVSNEDLYAGKICAALDRQHPRDLFDVGYILEEEFSDNLKYALIYYICSGNRPLHELLAPNIIAISDAFLEEFNGMANINTSIRDLEFNRETLFTKIRSVWNRSDKEFFLSFCNGAPNYNLIEVDYIGQMPSIKWKQHNIKLMDKTKKNQQLAKLEELLQ